MKHYIAIFMLCLTLSFFNTAQAQTPVNAQTAQTYTQNCEATRDPRMLNDTQEIFCQCTAMQMQKSYTMEDMQNLSKQDATGRAAVNKMLLNVYAPCMEFPVRDLIYAKCKADAYQAQQGICECLSKRMAGYMTAESQKLLGGILQRNPNIIDPITEIMASPEFAQKEKRIVLDCIQNPN